MGCALTACGQHWSDGMAPGSDWETAKAQFDSTWTDSLPARGKGFKPFHRWWDFAEKRWAFDGADAPEHERFRADAPWMATAVERAGRSARLDSIPTVWSKATPAGLPLVGGAGRVNRVVIDPSDSAHWVACAPGGGVWSSHDSGEHWALMGTADWAGIGASDAAFHPDEAGHLLVATGDSDFGSAYGVGLMRTTDGGQHWAPTALTFDLSETHTVNRVHRKSGQPDHLLVATSDGVWRSTDDGATFSRTLEGLCSDLMPHPGNPEVWYAALRPGSLHRSTDGGASWTPALGLPNPFGISRIAVSPSTLNPSEVWAVAVKASTQGMEGIYLSTDSGQSYVDMPDIPNLLGYTPLGSDLGGQGFYDLAIAVDPMNPDHVIVGGINVWESTDHGATWQCASHWYGADSIPEVHADHHALTFIPGSSDWVAAHDGGVARFFSNEELPPRDLSEGLDVGQIYRIGRSEDERGRLLTGWQDNGVNLLDGGLHAKVIGADGFHCLIMPGKPDTLYAAEYYGRTFRSADGGWSWAEWIGGNGSGVGERGDWNTPMQVAPAQPNRVFVAKRRLYWTDDDGANWNQSNALPGSPIEVLALSASEDSVAVVAKGTLAFRTTNLTQWSALTGLPGLPVLDALIHPANADTLWLAFGGYDGEARIRRSTDGGASWEEEGSGLPALPVNTLALDDPTGDLYAGTDAGVYVLPAGTEAWTPYKAGLPDVLCSDLQLRQSTGELLLATYGRGLWKAPLYSPPDRDAAAMRIVGTSPERCGAPPSVQLEFRNAGADTLVASSLVWNHEDTLNYGFVLPPNASTLLPWTGAPTNALDPGEILEVRILSVVGITGGVSHGTMSSAVDDVPDNDVARAAWGHRQHAGALVIETTADCRPLDVAWNIEDSLGASFGRQQHFPPERTVSDTLCLTHGCHTLRLHDAGGDGLTNADCGMEGDILWRATGGEVVWRLTEDQPGGALFHAGDSATVCLPVPGVVGCTDPTACNFNPAADLDDGGCDHMCPGQNCPSDLNGDGVHGATDILDVLSQFGCTQGCTMDVTGDGVVSANDILALLALYGQSCPD